MMLHLYFHYKVDALLVFGSEGLQFCGMRAEYTEGIRGENNGKSYGGRAKGMPRNLSIEPSVNPVTTAESSLTVGAESRTVGAARDRRAAEASNTNVNIIRDVGTGCIPGIHGINANRIY